MRVLESFHITIDEEFYGFWNHYQVFKLDVNFSFGHEAQILLLYYILLSIWIPQ